MARALMLCSAALLVFGCGPTRPATSGIAFVDGQWYGDGGFTEGTRYVLDGIFTERPPDSLIRTVDLKGGFVLPAFGDAHTHLLDDLRAVDSVAARLLERGILYVRSLNNSASGRRATADSWASVAGLELAYSNGGVTATLGHPMLLYEQLATGLFAPGGDEVERLFASRLRADDGYYAVDDVDDWSVKWPLLLSSGPDLIKIYLLGSEDYDPARPDTTRAGRKGLDPSLVPIIVKAAHREGLRVSAHVETAFDFRVAVHAGVDELAHMPGYGVSAARSANPARHRIDPSDAEVAGRRGTVVVATASVARQGAREDPDLLEQIVELQAHNLRVLIRHGVPLAIGSDANTLTFRSGTDALYEAHHLLALGVMDEEQLLRAWSDVTPRTIFPDRRIGSLRGGYEATFVILDGNPLEDFSAVERVLARFKRGESVGPDSL